MLGLHNAYQVYPWAVARHHPRSSLRRCGAADFFRRALRASDGIMVQTPLMAEYVRRIRGAPRRIAVISKAVETAEDVAFEPLPDSIVRQLDGGLGREAFTFVFIAVGYPHKNHAVLVSAMRHSARPGSEDADRSVGLGGRTDFGGRPRGPQPG